MNGDDQIVNDDESGFFVDWKNAEVVASGEIDPDCKQWEPDVFTQEEAANQKYPCLTPNGQTAEFWCEYSTADEEFIALSEFPYPYPDASVVNKGIVPQHNVQIEIENLGIGYVLTGDYEFHLGVEKSLKWLEENGLKPDVPFHVMATVGYYKSGGYSDYEEWESEIDVEIIK